MKKLGMLLLVCGIAAAMAGCNAPATGGNSSTPVSAETTSDVEYQIEYVTDAEEVTDEFFLDIREKSNQLVIETMQLTGEDIVPVAAEECGMVVYFEDLIDFVTRIDQGNDKYVGTFTWEKDEATGEWINRGIEINDVVYKDE